MGTSLNFTMDLIRLTLGDGQTLEPTYSAGLSDGFGDRLVFSTDPGWTTVELLRVRPELGAAPGFEHGLRTSAEALGQLGPKLATILAVDHVDELGGLALVSAHASGRRLSQVMPGDGRLALAVAFVSELGPTLARLHETGHTHGALTPDRILVSDEGHLIVLEHVLGAALRGLALPADRLRSVAGIAVPDGREAVAIEPRLDVLQLGFLALALATGQRLSPSDYPQHVGMLLEHLSRSSAGVADGFRPWLERALQVDGQPFTDAGEALAAFRELPPELFTVRDDAPTNWSEPSEPVIPAEAEDSVPVQTSDGQPPVGEGAREATDLLARLVPPYLRNRLGGARKVAAAIGAVVILQSAILAYSMFSGSSSKAGAGAPSTRYGMQAGHSASLATANLPSDGEAETRELAAPQSQSEPPLRPVDPSRSGSESPQAIDPLPAAVSPPPPAPADSQPASDAAIAEPPEPPVEPGSVEIVCSIALQLFEGEAELGSSDGPVRLPPGSHTIDAVNEELGFRSRQTVNVTSGATVSITVDIPNGRVDINAVPWADVWIDGVASGQTPLANVSLPIGEHEVLFRHPQLGERRESVTVKASGIARVSAVFQR